MDRVTANGMVTTLLAGFCSFGAIGIAFFEHRKRRSKKSVLFFLGCSVILLATMGLGLVNYIGDNIDHILYPIRNFGLVLITLSFRF